MKANPRVIELLQARRLDEITAIDQYSAHLAMAETWQYPALVEYLQERIADEKKHFEALGAWLVFLGQIPQSVPLSQIQIGPDVKAAHLFDQAAEVRAINLYDELITVCISVKDTPTRLVIEDILRDEVDHLRDLEARLKQIEQMGIQSYLQAQL